MQTSIIFTHSDFVQNKYFAAYQDIIVAAQQRDVNSLVNQYTETHHILPRSMGGTDAKSNLVVLTAREHYLVHACLSRCTTGASEVKMAYAFMLMNRASTDASKNGRYINSRLYEALKKKISILRTCPACGADHDRDLNAAYNIKNVGQMDLYDKKMSDATADLVVIPVALQKMTSKIERSLDESEVGHGSEQAPSFRAG